MVAVRRILGRSVDPWIAFFALVFAAWVTLFVASVELARYTGSAALGPGMTSLASLMNVLSDVGVLCGDHAHDSLATLVGMWGLMSLAMMAPTAIPLLRTYQHLAEGPAAALAHGGFHALLGGYVAVWALFSVAAGAAQHVLTSAGVLSGTGVSVSPWFTVSLLVIAGAYQFSVWKHACLNRCRSPMTFLLSRWRPGISGAFAMGLRHGADCVGCCWALMALALVGGTMNLVWMGAAMILMMVEKLPVGRRLSRPLGVVLIAGAGFVAISGPST